MHPLSLHRAVLGLRAAWASEKQERALAYPGTRIVYPVIVISIPLLIFLESRNTASNSWTLCSALDGVIA